MNDIRDGHYTLGKAYLHAEQYEEAITHFEQVLEIDLTFIDAHHALAYFGQHRLQDAKDAALEALKLDATYPPTLSFLQAIDPGASPPPEVPDVPIHSILKLPCQDDENLLHAVVDGVRRIQRRPQAKTHFILITDEPGNPKAPFEGTIALLKDLPVAVSVLGAADNFQQQVAAQTGGVYVTIPN